MNEDERLRLSQTVLREQFGRPLLALEFGAMYRLRRGLVNLGQRHVDPHFFPQIDSTPLRAPIFLVGLPRTGTTFLQRWCHNAGVGTGSNLWRMMLPSASLQWAISPLIPHLEPFSPTRHHPPEIHKGGLDEIEADDAALLFSGFHGFLVYAFFLAHHPEELLKEVDPGDGSRWLDRLAPVWARTLASSGQGRLFAKLFAGGAILPELVHRFPDCRLILTARDPLASIPSTLSLLRAILHANLGFGHQPKNIQHRYFARITDALVNLLERTERTRTMVAAENLLVVPHSHLQSAFGSTIREILAFVDHPVDGAMELRISEQEERQGSYESKHKYTLAEFGLEESTLRERTGFFTAWQG